VFGSVCGGPGAGSCGRKPSCRRMTFPARGRRPRPWCRGLALGAAAQLRVLPRADRLAEGSAHEVVEPRLPAQAALDGVMVMCERPDRPARCDHRALLVGDERTACPAGLVSHAVVPALCLWGPRGRAEPNAPGSRRRDGPLHRNTGANVKPGRRVWNSPRRPGLHLSGYSEVGAGLPGMPGTFPFGRLNSCQKAR
jgi:hypothetical protein